MNSAPLISCIAVSTGRLRMLKEAIGCYLAQTWPRRELIIVVGPSPRYEQAVEDHVAHLGRADIRIVRSEGDLRLGQRRNISIDEARGDFLCQWDDDDLSHPERLRLQYEAIERAGADACYLTEVLQYYTSDRALYWLDWSHFEPQGRAATMFPASLFVRRDPRVRYGESDLGEDIVARDRIFEHLTAVGLGGHAFLYVYRFHGANMWSRRHHESFLRTALPAPVLHQRSDTLRRALAAYRLPLPLEVRGGDGAAFCYTGPAPHDFVSTPAPPERPQW